MAFYWPPLSFDPFREPRYVDPLEEIFESCSPPALVYMPCDYLDDDSQLEPLQYNNQAKNKRHTWHAIVDVSTFNPETIFTNIDGNKIIVTARKEIREGDDFLTSELRKTVEAPLDVDLSKLEKNFVCGNLVITAPKIDTSGCSVPVQISQSYVKNAEGEAMQMEKTDDEQTVSTIDDPHHFQLQLDLHSFKPENIKITTKGRTLTINAHQEEKTDDHFFKSSFKRSFLLPANVDPQKLKSRFNQDGTLNIRVKDDGLEDDFEKIDLADADLSGF